MTGSSKFTDAPNLTQGPEGEWRRILLEFKTHGRQEPDPTHRVSLLESAQKEVVSIGPTDTVEEAFTLMLNHDYSQLSVLDGHNVRGIFSWRSHGKQVAKGRECKIVSQCIEPAAIIDLTDSIFEAFAMVARNEYVLVRDDHQHISGIVTSFDISELFAKLDTARLCTESNRVTQDLWHMQHSQ
ncbi:MAG TPA: CBS domain-containing protein [Bryobacteraceae bacterium]|nr:CBS domain-containing protein [Bryobacteraceae bacterium]